MAYLARVYLCYFTPNSYKTWLKQNKTKKHILKEFLYIRNNLKYQFEFQLGCSFMTDTFEGPLANRAEATKR